MAGASARREYERRKASDDARGDAHERSVRARHPRIGGVLIALADNGKERQTTAAWRVGAVGEVAVGKRLDDWAASSGGYVLHDRRIPGTRANIDHMAIGASGVWVIDAKLYTTGRVEHVDRGGWSRSDWRLTVGGRDQSKLAGGVLKQTDLVASALNDAAGGVGGPEVHGMLCFVAADWRFFARPFIHAGVHVGWPAAMVQLLGRAGPDVPSAWKAAAAILARKFPSA